MHRIALGATLALIAASTTNAQQAVQWRIEDGGNGHWYRLVPEALNWASARDRAVSLGGHLATLTSQAEADFVVPLGTAHAWLGASTPPNQGCGTGGWSWVTGEPWAFMFWAPGEPNGCSETALAFNSWGGYTGRWNNNPPGLVPLNFFMEWSADCNGDGIVDYGQCRDGTLPDYNGNNIPDCCESESPCAPNLIVNGGFEFGASQTDCTWVVHATGESFVPGWTVIAASIDRLRISDSCPPGTESWTSFEGEFTIDLDGDTNGGAISQTVATEPGSRYRLSFHLTGNCAPGIKQMRVEIGSTQHPFEHACSGTNPQLWSEKSVEFTAAASVTDIVFRSVSTSGRNGAVIDLVKMIRLEPQQPTCQSADLLADRNVNGADLGILLAQWGPNTQYTISDINHDGVVDGIDLGLLLSFWGPCSY